MVDGDNSETGPKNPCDNNTSEAHGINGIVECCASVTAPTIAQQKTNADPSPRTQVISDTNGPLVAK